MKLLTVGFLVFLLHLCAISAHSVDDTLRVKRSNETEVSTFKKFTNGFKSFGNKITSTATKGYEEVKNLFSRDRKVGDYTLDTIDVRFQEEEDYEEVAVKKPKKTKRETDLKMKPGDRDVSLEEIIKDINVLKTTTKGPQKLDNNAETAPGVPKVEAVYIAPLTCPEGQILQDGKCSSLNKKKTVKVTAV